MKTLLLLLLCCCLGGSALATRRVTLAWDANPEPGIAGYRLHYGTASGVYSLVVDVGPVLTAVVPELFAGTSYFFAVTAYNVAGESVLSDELSCLLAPDVPRAAVTRLERLADGSIELTLSPVPTSDTSALLALEVSADLESWTVLAWIPAEGTTSFVLHDPAAAAAPQRFYRLHAYDGVRLWGTIDLWQTTP